MLPDQRKWKISTRFGASLQWRSYQRAPTVQSSLRAAWPSLAWILSGSGHIKSGCADQVVHSHFLKNDVQLEVDVIVSSKSSANKDVHVEEYIATFE